MVSWYPSAVQIPGQLYCRGTSSAVTVVHVDQQLSLDHVEKLVVIVVLVPVILAFNYAQANHRFVHLAKRLVIPLVGAGGGERPLVDYFALLVVNV